MLRNAENSKRSLLAVKLVVTLFTSLLVWFFWHPFPNNEFDWKEVTNLSRFFHLLHRLARFSMAMGRALHNCRDDLGAFVGHGSAVDFWLSEPDGDLRYPDLENGVQAVRWIRRWAAVGNPARFCRTPTAQQFSRRKSDLKAFESTADVQEIII